MDLSNSKKIETEIVIMGGGGGGLSAAVVAKERGGLWVELFDPFWKCPGICHQLRKDCWRKFSKICSNE